MAQRRLKSTQDDLLAAQVGANVRNKEKQIERPPNSMFIISIKKIFVYLSIVQTLLGLLEIVFCDMVVSSSGSHYPGMMYILNLAFYQLISLVICFAAATNWCAPLKNPEDPQRYFAISSLSVVSVISCTFRAITQGSNYAKLLTLEACADSSLTRIVGNTSHYYRAYLCEIENASKSTCSCVNSDLQCLSYESVDSGTCANMIEILPGQVYTTYFLAILCGVLCLLMSVLSMMSWRFNHIIKYEDDEDRQDFQVQIIGINFLAALSFTSGAYFFFSSGTFETVLNSIKRSLFLAAVTEPDILKHEVLSTIESMTHSDHAAKTVVSNASLLSFSLLLFGAIAGSIAFYTIYKSVREKKTAEANAEDELQNPGTSTVEIIRHLNVGKFDHLAAKGKDGKVAPSGPSAAAAAAGAAAAPAKRVSSSDYYEEITRVSTVDILDTLQNPMRAASKALGGKQASLLPQAKPSSSNGAESGSEIDTLGAIRRLTNNTVQFLGNNKEASASVVMGVPKTNTIDIMDEIAGKGGKSLKSPYSPQQEVEKENSYYNLNTIEFIRNGENATGKNNNNNSNYVQKKPASSASGSNKDAAAVNGWFANISLQNPFDKK